MDSLRIPCGEVALPPLLWKATKNDLYIYALMDSNDPNENTSLMNVPFFNLYEDGRVCMGTVKINIAKDCLLEEFMQQWQSYFFNSFFSHLLGEKSPVATVD